MKKVINKFLLYVGIFILLILTFNISLYISSCFNSNLIERKVSESYEILNKEGMFYKISNLFNIRSDNSADALIINECYSIDSKEPYMSYMKARKNYKNGLSNYEIKEDVGELKTYVEIIDDETKEYYNTIAELGDLLHDRIHIYKNYGRYWHGYLVFIRPLLLIFNIMQLRNISFLVFSILFLYFINLIYKKFGKDIAVIYGLSLICSGYFSASYILEVSPVFILMMISSIVLLKNIDKIKDFSIYIFIISCITNFIDYLTVPLITLCIPISIYLLKLFRDKKDFKYCIKFLIKNSFIWLFGYSFTWISKWVLYDLTIKDTSMLNIGFGQALFRMQRVNEAVGISVSYISIILEILMKSMIYILVTLLILLFLNSFKFNKLNKNAITFLLLSSYAIIWYIVLANHTILHNYFTYRNSLIFMLSILLFLKESFFYDLKKG